MIDFLRKIVFPLSLLYGMVTSIRNYLYNIGVFSSKSFSIPIIAVGNLSVGGTGKTPQIEYLVRLLQEKYRIAILSRGYKRTTKGFIKANENATAQTIGDEPFQYCQKFENVGVYVDADRVNGVQQILKEEIKPDIILLDDAFQHRRIKAGKYILLTPYDKLYCNDYLLPTGNLRESKKGAKRADIIIVTKCPKSLSINEQENIKRQLQPLPNQKIFFSHIEYNDNLRGNAKLHISDLQKTPFTLVTGIANPTPLVVYLKEKGLSFKHLKFADHHHFSEKDMDNIKKQDGIILTTEKDYTRLKGRVSNLYYIEIKVGFIADESIFNQNIIDYIGEK